MNGFLERALIIDDKPEEVEGLKKVLEENDVAVTCFTPEQLKNRDRLPNGKIIFLDICLNSTIREHKGHLSIIRSILKDNIGKDFGPYGIVLWSAHTKDYIKDLCVGITSDKAKNTYCPPLFIIGLNKYDYLKEETQYASLFNDLKKKISEDPSADFVVRWFCTVKDARDRIVNKIYSLVPDYSEASKSFLYILRKIALNYTGISEASDGYPLHVDAFKAFDELLHAELINSQKDVNDIFKKPMVEVENNKPDNWKNICAHLNTALLIDDNNIDQNTVVPGNVYEIVEEENPFKMNKTSDGAIKIAVEITPPCDFAQKDKRVKARLIGGFAVELNDEGDTKKQVEKMKCDKECFYKGLYPIYILGTSKKKPCVLILDFRYFGSEDDANLKNSDKYKILFRAKPKLFADILQKFSSHSARLGLSVIHP